MPSSLNFPRVVLPPGTREFGNLAIPDGDTLLRLSADRTVPNGLNASPAAAVVLLYVDVSGDGGASWTWAGGTQMTGGIYVYPKTGLEEDTDYIEVGLAPGTGRLAKARVIVGAGGGSVAVAGSLATT